MANSDKTYDAEIQEWLQPDFFINLKKMKKKSANNRDSKNTELQSVHK